MKPIKMMLLKPFFLTITFALSGANDVPRKTTLRDLKTGAGARYPECKANPVCAKAGLDGECCPTTELVFLDCCFETLAPSPTLSPGKHTCQPTSGKCASTAIELQYMFDNAKKQEIIAICDAQTIVVTNVIKVFASSLTLCCDGSDCVIERTDDDIDTNLLIVYGSSFTVQDISFVNGKAGTNPINIDPNQVSSGGNLYIFATGNHKIINCNFYGGQAVSGGNLSIQGYDDGSPVSIQDSTFVDGTATYGGAGATISNIDNVTISNCNFTGNNAGNSAGALGLGTGFSNIDFPEWKKITIIKDSYFGFNTASNFGGAFTYGVDTSIGTLATLSILNTVFEDNISGEQGGGVGSIAAGDCPNSPSYPFDCYNTMELVLSGNIDLGNSGQENCDGIWAFLPEIQTCFPVDEDLIFS